MTPSGSNLHSLLMSELNTFFISLLTVFNTRLLIFLLNFLSVLSINPVSVNGLKFFHVFPRSLLQSVLILCADI